VEEKTIEISNHLGRVRRERNGSIRIEGGTGPSIYLGMDFGNTAREFAHAILELIGVQVPGKEFAKEYLITQKYGGERVAVFEEENNTEAIAYAAQFYDGDMSLYRLVADIGPIPQPERKITRYE